MMRLLKYTLILTVSLLAISANGMAMLVNFDGAYLHSGEFCVKNQEQETKKWKRKPPYRTPEQKSEAEAQYDLGHRLELGIGVPQDDQAALECIRKAAKGGNAPAQINLGLRYKKGKGVPLDKEKGIKLIRKAGNQINLDLLGVI